MGGGTGRAAVVGAIWTSLKVWKADGIWLCAMAIQTKDSEVVKSVISLKFGDRLEPIYRRIKMEAKKEAIPKEDKISGGIFHSEVDIHHIHFHHLLKHQILGLFSNS